MKYMPVIQGNNCIIKLPDLGPPVNCDFPVVGLYQCIGNMNVINIFSFNILLQSR